MREGGPVALNHLGEGLIVQCYSHICAFIMRRGHQQRSSRIADHATGPMAGTAGNDSRNRIPGECDLLHASIDSPSEASCIRSLLELLEVLVLRTSHDPLGMSTDPPKELLFKEGLELCDPVSIWGKLPNGL